MRLVLGSGAIGEHGGELLNKKGIGKPFLDGMKDWKPEELVFNAIAWKEGYRFFWFSRDLSIIMKRIDKKNN